MLYLIRHANPHIEPDVAASQWHLSPLGMVRAHQFAAHLAGCGIEHFIASSEPKAIQTAQLLAQDLEVPVTTADNLHEHERPQVGFMTRAKFTNLVARFFANPTQLVFGQETADQAFKRFDGAVSDVLARYSAQTLAIVSHGTVLSLFISRHCNLDAFTFWQALGLPACITLAWPECRLLETWTPPDPPSAFMETDDEARH